MLYLLTASMVWAFSFGLIKQNLADLDSNFVALVRLLISFAVFAPLMRPGKLGFKLTLELLFLGGVQYGLMYMSYIYSYRFLAAHQVALFTIFTPIYVTLINDLYRKRFHRMFLLTAVLAVAGTAVIVRAQRDVSGILAGFLVLQVSNVCFALGQVRYRMLLGLTGGSMPSQPAGGRTGNPVTDRDVFGLMYLGAVLVTSLPACFTAGWAQILDSGSGVHSSVSWCFAVRCLFLPVERRGEENQCRHSGCS